MDTKKELVTEEKRKLEIPLGVTCEYHGRTGNNIFQYVFARLIAEKNGLAMDTAWIHPDFIRVTTPAPGDRFVEPVVGINDLYWNQHDIDWFSRDFRGKRVMCSGFFQSPMYYDKHTDLVKSFFDLDKVEKRPKNEIVMHVRLDDYADPGLQSVIAHTWYAKILTSMQFNTKKNKLYIVTDPKSKDDPYLKKFIITYQPTIISNSAAEDFHFMREFDTIICSNSSFAWWAAWLSEASRIFTFSKWIREPHGQRIKLPLTKRATPVYGDWMWL